MCLFGLETVFGIPLIYYLFEVGFENLFSETKNDLELHKNCGYYITFWFLFWIPQPIFYMGMIFTRYVFVR